MLQCLMKTLQPPKLLSNGLTVGALGPQGVPGPPDPAASGHTEGLGASVAGKGSRARVCPSVRMIFS